MMGESKLIPRCPSCGSETLRKFGKYCYHGESQQKWMCIACGSTTTFPLWRRQRKVSQKSVVQVFDGTIPAMRDAGHTLQEIGDKCGVTRERVRQVLQEFYPGHLHPPKKQRLSDRLGMTERKMRRLAGDNCIELPSGEVYYEDCPPEIVYRLLKANECRICGQQIPKSRSSFCSPQCYHEAHKYIYWAPEQKAAQDERTRRWQREHPERTKEIGHKATSRYQERRRNRHKYVIISPLAPIPVGEVVANAGARVGAMMKVRWHEVTYSVCAYHLRTIKEAVAYGSSQTAQS